MTPQEAISMISVTGSFTVLLITILLHFVLGNAVDDMFSLYLHFVSMILSSIYVLFIAIVTFQTDVNHNLIWGILIYIFWFGYNVTYYWMLSRQVKLVITWNLKNFNITMYSLMAAFAFLGIVFYPLALKNDTDSLRTGLYIVDILTVVVVNGLIILFSFYTIRTIFKTVMSLNVKSYNEILIRMNLIILVIAVADLGLVLVELFEPNYRYNAIRGCFYAFRTQIQYLCLGKVRQVYMLIRENQTPDDEDDAPEGEVNEKAEVVEPKSPQVDRTNTNATLLNDDAPAVTTEEVKVVDDDDKPTVTE